MDLKGVTVYLVLENHDEHGIRFYEGFSTEALAQGYIDNANKKWVRKIALYIEPYVIDSDIVGTA
jgi:hypothetical protein